MIWAVADETFKKVHQLPNDVKLDVYTFCYLLLSCCFEMSYLFHVGIDIECFLSLFLCSWPISFLQYEENL